MPLKANSIIILVVGLATTIVVFVLFHPGGFTWQFGPLTGALTGGLLVLFSTMRAKPHHASTATEPWVGRERTGWTLIGCGLILWGMGECVWRYFVLKHQNTFPSLADIGYSMLPPFIFVGLLLQPSSGSTLNKKILLVLDCLIAMASLLSIGWYLLLGSLVQASSENLLAKFLGLYYPITDIGLLSCVVFLFLRGQDQLYLATARRVALLVLGFGLGLFAISDFLFNIQQSAGTYVEGTWIDLGWPLGLLTIGLAAYLRHQLPRISHEALARRLRKHHDVRFGFAQVVTYITLALLLLVLILNVLSPNTMQVAIRPVLLFATVLVIALVVARQIITSLENQRLTLKQAEALERLENANHYIEEQARKIAEHNKELEDGIVHLKEVQAHLANGNLRVRATLSSGELLPLAASLNLMADRLTRLGQADIYARFLIQALDELAAAIERSSRRFPFMLPKSSTQFPQIKRLMYTLHMKGIMTVALPSSPSPVIYEYPSPVATPAMETDTLRKEPEGLPRRHDTEA